MNKNHIDDDVLDYVGILAKLDLSGDERDALRGDLEELLDYVDRLNELDVTGVEPMSHAFSLENVFREDAVTNGDGADDTISNAPEEKDRMFVVPKTIGG